MKIFKIAALFGIAAASDEVERRREGAPEEDVQRRDEINFVTDEVERRREGNPEEDNRRHRDETGSIYELTGEENTEEMMDMLMEMTGQAERFERGMEPGQERNTIRLKMMVLHLQQQQDYERYKGYGCHCIPEGTTGGYGKPMDSLDMSCQELKQCYLCARKAFNDSCRNDFIGYGVRYEDDGYGIKSLECKSKDGSCRRSLCECDKAFAEKLAKYEGKFDALLSPGQSDHNRDQYCVRMGGGSPADSCCGDKFTFPFNQPKNANKCCDGWEAKPAGTCG